MNSIHAQGLDKAFSTGPVLCGLDLAVPEQSLYGLLGRNGAGKTTLLRLLIGLLHADKGHALVLGQPLADGCPPEKARVAYVAQGEFLPGWARIGDLVRFEAALRPDWDPTCLGRWLKAESLTHKRPVSKLSVGQRKRLELELALAARPAVMLMDEPFAGLDPVSRAEFTDQLLEYAGSASVTIVLSSHVLSDLERFCDRIGVLAGGKIAFEAAMDELKEQAAVVTTSGPKAREELPCDAVQTASWQTNGSRTWVLSGLGDAQAAALDADGFNVTRGSLEDLGTELLRRLGAR